jgi:hypothetical protein
MERENKQVEEENLNKIFNIIKSFWKNLFWIIKQGQENINWQKYDIKAKNIYEEIDKREKYFNLMPENLKSILINLEKTHQTENDLCNLIWKDTFDKRKKYWFICQHIDQDKHKKIIITYWLSFFWSKKVSSIN